TESAAGNSLFAGVPSGQATWDALRMSDAGSGLGYSAWLRAGSGRDAALDGVRLQVIDHSSDTRPYLVGQAAVLGSRTAASQALVADDANVAVLLDGTAREPFVGRAGSHVTLTLPGQASDPLVLEARRLSMDVSASDGIQVQVPDGSGWRQVALVAP